jgi:hypothetical protein
VSASKSEALKDSAIVELLRVVDQELEICGLAPKKLIMQSASRFLFSR